MYIFNLMSVYERNEEVNPTQNIRLQESTLLHLQSQGDKSEKCLAKGMWMCMHQCVYAPQYYKHRTVQMLKKT